MKEKGIVHLYLLILLLVATGVIYFLNYQGLIKLPSGIKVPGKSSEASVSLQTQYENPFDESAQYTNPFDSYKNPFDSLK